jgi:hypothetical protein
VVFRSGPSEPLAALLDGPDLVVRRERQWMLRFVDVAAAVAARGYRTESRGRVALDLDDRSAGGTGRWTLHVADGTARSLERGAAAPSGSASAPLPRSSAGGRRPGLARVSSPAVRRAISGRSTRVRRTAWMLDEF